MRRIVNGSQIQTLDEESCVVALRTLLEEGRLESLKQRV